MLSVARLRGLAPMPGDDFPWYLSVAILGAILKITYLRGRPIPRRPRAGHRGVVSSQYLAISIRNTKKCPGRLCRLSAGTPFFSASVDAIVRFPGPDFTSSQGLRMGVADDAERARAVKGGGRIGSSLRGCPSRMEAATDRKRERHTCAALAPLRLFHLFMLCFTAFQCKLMFKTRNRLQKNNNLWRKLLILWFFLNYLFYQIYIMNILHVLQWTFHKAFILRYTLLHDFFHILLFYFIEFLSLFLNRTLKVMIIVRAK